MRIRRSKFLLLVTLAFGCGDSGGGREDAGTDAAHTEDAEVDAFMPDCTPGATRCSGLVPETCDASGTWISGTACAFVCDAGACTGECVPGAKRCTGTQPEICNAAGVFEATGEACEFVCTAGDCDGACVPGTTRCEGLSPQSCDESGQYVALSADCAFVCADAACTGTCVPGTKRCAGNAVELCDATGTFIADETCSQLCDAGACICDADHSGDGYDCEPLDFCDPSRGGCGPNATCTQTGVMPSCECNDGYEGAGLACSLPPTAPVLTEDFDDFAALAAAGWEIRNSSSPIGSTTWQAGHSLPGGTQLSAYNGAPASLVGADYNSTGNIGTISTWLVSPELDFGDGASFSFYTRTRLTSSYADRVEVRVCATLPCAAPGQGSVSGFETVLRSINPDLIGNGYPAVWTEYVLTNADGIPRHGRGRIAFRYFVTGSGQNGTNGVDVYIDAVRYSVGAAGHLVSGDVSFVGEAADVTLSLNRQSSLPITSSGGFTFPNTLSPGTPYVITVLGAPAGTTCSVTNGTGTMGTADVTDVMVGCTTE